MSLKTQATISLCVHLLYSTYHTYVIILIYTYIYIYVYIVVLAFFRSLLSSVYISFFLALSFSYIIMYIYVHPHHDQRSMGSTIWCLRQVYELCKDVKASDVYIHEDPVDLHVDRYSAASSLRDLGFGVLGIQGLGFRVEHLEVIRGATNFRN